jgi:hypothetical protein
MRTFLSVCLYVFSACAGLGIVPAAVLAARARQPLMAAASVVFAGFIIFVLITAALDLTAAH